MTSQIFIIYYKPDSSPNSQNSHPPSPLFIRINRPEDGEPAEFSHPGGSGQDQGGHLILRPDQQLLRDVGRMRARPWQEGLCPTAHLYLSPESLIGIPTATLGSSAKVSLVLALSPGHAQGGYVPKFHPQIWTQMVAHICMYNQLGVLAWLLLALRGMFMSLSPEELGAGAPQGLPRTIDLEGGCLRSGVAQSQ